jgi:hypothetical protein
MFLVDVTSDFDLACAEICRGKPEGFALFVKEHERRPLVLRNLCHQILTAEKRMRVKFDATMRMELVRSVASMFVSAIELKREQDNWSASRKIQEDSKGQIYKDVAHLIKEI